MPIGQESDLIQAFVDTDFASDQRTRHPASCGIVQYAGECVTLYSRGQGVVATSSGESELYGIGSGIIEALGVRSLLRGLNTEA